MQHRDSAGPAHSHRGAVGFGQVDVGCASVRAAPAVKRLLLLGGFDHHSLRPERWRQRAAGVPQSHENHILSAPLLFNMAMARRWPPHAQDEQEIEAICRDRACRT